MAHVIQLGYSNTSGQSPNTLAGGEVGVNTNNRKVWVGNGSGNTLVFNHADYAPASANASESYVTSRGYITDGNTGWNNSYGFVTSSGVTSVATSGAINGGTITSTGTISHSTAAGNKHIPTGGSSGQFLKYSSSGTAVWAADNNTTYTLSSLGFTGATNANYFTYSHPSHPGDDFGVDTGALTGATVVSDVDINVTTDTQGHVTDANGSVATRTLTLANLGYTGATNANYFTCTLSSLGGITAAYAEGLISDVVDSAPAALNTLNELAAALGDDSSYATTITNALAGKSSTSHNHSSLYAPIAHNASQSWVSSNFNNYSHPTGSGNKHIPSGGSSGQFLKYSSSGTAVWAADNNTTYTLSSLGYTGATNANYFTYSHPTGAGNKHIPSGGSSGQFLKYSSSGTAVWAADNNTTYTLSSLGFTGATNANYITNNNQLTNGAGYTNNTVANAALPKAGGTMTGNTVVNNYGIGNVGLYHASKYQAVWSMGAAYVPSANGSAIGSVYGIIWTHTNMGGESKAGLSHQALFVHAGTTRTAIGHGIWTQGVITGTSNLVLSGTATWSGGGSANANTAYGWGNHASAGYITDGNTGWNNSYGFVTSSGNTVIGTDTDISISGASVIDSLTLTDGVITAHGTRNLTLANLGYTGATNANYFTYSHPTGAGNKHIPSGGSSGQFLKYSSSGTAVWAADNNTTYTLSSLGYTGATNANYFTYTHPTTAGNKHIPSGGSSGQFLKYSSSGTAVWAADNNTTYTLSSLGFTGATNANYFTYSHPTSAGNKHIPSGGSSGQFLKYSSSGTAVWAADNNTTYTLSSLGFTGATNANYFTYTHPTSAGNKHIPSGGSSGQFLKYSSSGTATWAADNNTTYTLSSLGFTGATNANYITNNNQLTNGAGYTTAVGDITGVTAGTACTGGGTSGAVTINVSLGNSSSTCGRGDWAAYAYDHATGFAPNGYRHIPASGSSGQFLGWSSTGNAAWVSNPNTNTTYSASNGCYLSGTDIRHTDTSSQASVNNSGQNFIQDITLDTYGHITAITSATASGGGGSVTWNDLGNISALASLP